MKKIVNYLTEKKEITNGQVLTLIGSVLGMWVLNQVCLNRISKLNDENITLEVELGCEKIKNDVLVNRLKSEYDEK